MHSPSEVTSQYDPPERTVHLVHLVSEGEGGGGGGDGGGEGDGGGDGGDGPTLNVCVCEYPMMKVAP